MKKFLALLLLAVSAVHADARVLHGGGEGPPPPPPPPPTTLFSPVTPSYVSTAGNANSTIAFETVTMPGGGTFTGTCSLGTGGDNALVTVTATTGGCTLKVGTSDVTVGRDLNIALTATQGGFTATQGMTIWKWDNSDAVQTRATAVTGDAAIRITENNGGGLCPRITRTISMPGGTYLFSVNMAPGTSHNRFVALEFHDVDETNNAYLSINPADGTLQEINQRSGVSITNYKAVPLSPSGFNVSMYVTAAHPIAEAQVALITPNETNGFGYCYAADGASNAVVWNPQYAAAPAVPMRTKEFTRKWGVVPTSPFAGGPATSDNIAMMQSIGLTLARNSINTEAQAADNGAYAAAGIRSQIDYQYGFGGAATDMGTWLGWIKTYFLTPHPGSVAGLDGTNEIDISADQNIYTPTGNSGFLGGNDALHDMYRIAKADPAFTGIPIQPYSLSIFPYWDDPTASEMGNQTATCDASSIHNYPHGDNLTPQYPQGGSARNIENNVEDYTTYNRQICQKPLNIDEESGLCTPENGNCDGSAAPNYDVSYVVASKVYMEMFIANAKRLDYFGITRFLLCCGDDWWAIFHDIGVPKPEAVAIGNAMTVLADTSGNALTFTPTPLQYTLFGMPASSSSTLLQNSDGSSWLLLSNMTSIWDSVNQVAISIPDTTVKVAFQEPHVVTVYSPTVSAAPATSFGNTTLAPITLNDAPLFVHIQPGTGASQAIASITPSTCAFTGGVANGTICSLSVAMAPTSPAFSGTLGFCTGTNTPVTGCTGNNAGGFQISGGNTILQSSGGTTPGVYNVTVFATQGAPVANSPQFQTVTLTGSGPTPTLVNSWSGSTGGAGSSVTITATGYTGKPLVVAPIVCTTSSCASGTSHPTIASVTGSRGDTCTQVSGASNAGNTSGNAFISDLWVCHGGSAGTDTITITTGGSNAFFLSGMAYEWNNITGTGEAGNNCGGVAATQSCTTNGATTGVTELVFVNNATVFACSSDNLTFLNPGNPSSPAYMIVPVPGTYTGDLTGCGTAAFGTSIAGIR